MSFVSLSFFLFFPIVATAYFLTPHRFRWALLLAASSIFYMAFIPKYILILFGLIAVNYLAGIFLERTQGRNRTYLLWASIAATIGILFVFKYFDFFTTNVAALADFLHWNYSLTVLQIALPLGLSFHTFQSLSYVIEVYRGKQKAEKHLGIFALYVLFFPQLVAGPIERPQNLLHQFREEHRFDYDRVRLGLIRMAWGFFKKMAVADHLAIVVDRVYANPSLYDGPSLLIATVFFTFQLYFDFSAYCDIALGAAQVMGFTLMENFNRPFAAKSMAEFWHRWHISLSSWFRDYFYYPLVLARKEITRARVYAAVLITFLVTGFWHGANWTFGIFGALHGGYIVFGMMTQKLRRDIAETVGLLRVPALHRLWQVAVIFSCAAIASIFFRARNVHDGWYILTHLFSGSTQMLNPSGMSASISQIASSGTSFAAAIILTAGVLWVEYLGREKGPVHALSSMPWYVRWSWYWGMLLLILAVSQNTSSAFIYFQF